MAPHQSRKSEPAANHESASEESEQESQDHGIEALRHAQNIVSKFKNTREDKRKAIEAEHKKRVKDTAAKIDALFEARNKRITKSRNDAFARLAAMNKKRRDIEQAILASMRTVEIHSSNISSELNAMFSGRVEEIRDPALGT